MSHSLQPYELQAFLPIKRKQPPPVAKSAEDAQFQNPPPPNQQEQATEPKTPQGTSSDKVAEAPQVGAASQSFEQALALTTLPVGGASKEKNKEVPLEAVDKAPKAKLQIKFKPQFFSFCRIVKVSVILFLFLKASSIKICTFPFVSIHTSYYYFIIHVCDLYFDNSLFAQKHML